MAVLSRSKNGSTGETSIGGLKDGWAGLDRWMLLHSHSATDGKQSEQASKISAQNLHHHQTAVPRTAAPPAGRVRSAARSAHASGEWEKRQRFDSIRSAVFLSLLLSVAVVGYQSSSNVYLSPPPPVGLFSWDTNHTIFFVRARGCVCVLQAAPLDGLIAVPTEQTNSLIMETE